MLHCNMLHCNTTLGHEREDHEMATSKPKNPAEQANVLYKSLVDYAIDVNRVVVTGLERSWQEQVEAVEGAFERIKPLADVKEPAELVSAQLALAKDLNKQAVATTTSLFQIQRETGSELGEIANASVKASVEALVASMPKAA